MSSVTLNQNYGMLLKIQHAVPKFRAFKMILKSVINTAKYG